MAESSIKTYLIGTVIFTMLVLFVFGAISLVNNNTQVGDGSSSVTQFVQDDTLTNFNRTFNKADELEPKIQNLSNSVSNLKPDNLFDAITLPAAFISTAWEVMKLVIDMFSFMNSALEGVGAILGLPSWVGLMLVLIVVIFLVMGVLALIFGREP